MQQKRSSCFRSQLDAYVFSPVEENSEDSLENFELRFPGLVQHKYKINLQDEMENLLDTFLRDVSCIFFYAGT